MILTSSSSTPSTARKWSVFYGRRRSRLTGLFKIVPRVATFGDRFEERREDVVVVRGIGEMEWHLPHHPIAFSFALGCIVEVIRKVEERFRRTRLSDVS